MKITLKTTVFFAFFLIQLFSCRSIFPDGSKNPLADTKASNSSRKLYNNLHHSAKSGFAIGHQDDLAYGVGWKHGQSESEGSDVYSITGDFPGAFGFDIAGIEKADSVNIDGVPFDLMKQLIKEAYSKGGIVTISWHADNPVTNGDSWDTTRAVASILNDPAILRTYEEWVSELASFLKKLRYRGKRIPILFRPLHEMNGSWFWWGDPNCSPEEYKKLWIKTVQLLRDEFKVHNLLYVYSPNTLDSTDTYLKYYPGDEYVDILGIDIYDFYNNDNYLESVRRNLDIVRKLAVERNKLYAFTETGLEKIEKENWFSNLYPVIENSGISWILFWRNANDSHHYIPYPGHPSEKDFMLFSSRSRALLLNDFNSSLKK